MSWFCGIVGKAFPTPKLFKNAKFSSTTFLFFKDFIHLFLETGKGGEREGEKHQCVVASPAPPTGDLARNPGMCPD